MAAAAAVTTSPSLDPSRLMPGPPRLTLDQSNAQVCIPQSNPGSSTGFTFQAARNPGSGSAQGLQAGFVFPSQQGAETQANQAASSGFAPQVPHHLSSQEAVPTTPRTVTGDPARPTSTQQNHCAPVGHCAPLPMTASQRLGLTPAQLANPPSGPLGGPSYLGHTSASGSRPITASQHLGLQFVTPLGGVPVNVAGQGSGSGGQMYGPGRIDPGGMLCSATRKRRLTGSHTFSGCLASAAAASQPVHHSIQKSNTLPNRPAQGNGKGPVGPPPGMVLQGRAPPLQAPMPPPPVVLTPKTNQGFNPVAFASGIKALEGTPLGRLLNATPDIVVDGIPRRIVKTGGGSGSPGVGGVLAHAARLNTFRVFAPQGSQMPGHSEPPQDKGVQKPAGHGSFLGPMSYRDVPPSQGAPVAGSMQPEGPVPVRPQTAGPRVPGVGPTWVQELRNCAMQQHNMAKENGSPRGPAVHQRGMEWRGTDPLMGQDSGLPSVYQGDQWPTEALQTQESRTAPQAAAEPPVRQSSTSASQQQQQEHWHSSRQAQQHQQQQQQQQLQQPLFDPLSGPAPEEMVSTKAGGNQEARVGSFMFPLSPHSSTHTFQELRGLHSRSLKGPGQNGQGLEPGSGEALQRHPSQGSVGTSATRPSAFQPTQAMASMLGRVHEHSPGLRLHLPGLNPSPEKAAGGHTSGSALDVSAPMLVESPSGVLEQERRDALQQPVTPTLLSSPQEPGVDVLANEDVDMDCGNDDGDGKDEARLGPQVFQFFPCSEVAKADWGVEASAQAFSPGPGSEVAGAGQQQRQVGKEERQLFPVSPSDMPAQHLMCKEKLDPPLGGHVRKLLFGEGGGMSWKPEGEGHADVAEGAADAAEGGEGELGGDVDLSLGLNLMARSMSVSSTSSATGPTKSGSAPAGPPATAQAGAGVRDGEQESNSWELRHEGEVKGSLGITSGVVVPQALRVSKSTVKFLAVCEVAVIGEGDSRPIVLANVQQLYSECLDWPEVAVFSQGDGRVAWVNKAYAAAMGQQHSSSWADSLGAAPVAVLGCAALPLTQPVVVSATLHATKAGGADGGGPKDLVLPARGRRVESLLRSLLGYLWTANRL